MRLDGGSVRSFGKIGNYLIECRIIHQKQSVYRIQQLRTDLSGVL